MTKLRRRRSSVSFTLKSFLFIVICIVPSSTKRANSYCITRNKVPKSISETDSQTDSSIGIDLFYAKSKDDASINSNDICNSPETRDLDNDQNFIHLYPVIINNKILKGWLLLNYGFSDFASGSYLPKVITAVAINAEDENGQAFGQFSEVPYKYCTDATEISPYQRIYCMGTPANEPLTPESYYFVSPIIFPGVEPYVLPKANIQQNLYLYWKFSQNYCNKKQKMRLRVTVGTRDRHNENDCRIAKYYWINIKDFGSTDIFPEKDLDASKKIQCGGADQWGRKDNWFTVDTNPPVPVVIDGSYFVKNCGLADYGITFNGRCATTKPTNLDQQEGSEDNELICSPYVDTSKDLKEGKENYDAYVAKRFQKLGIRKNSENCCDPALAEEIKNKLPVPTTTTTIPTTTTTTEPPKTTAKLKLSPVEQLEKEEEEKRVGLLLYADSDDIWSTGGRVWRMRQFHGICFTIATLFVLPVNFFMARYYKETFMKHRIYYCMVWYFVHVISVPLMLFLILLGVYVATKAQQVTGHSLHDASWYHRVWGWTFIIFFFVVSLIGGIRFYSDVSRRVSMFFHWLCGTTIYVGFITLILKSMEIPGSPSATYDVAAEDKEESAGKKWYDQQIYSIIIVWIITEIIFHIVMSLQLCAMDMKLNFSIARHYTPAPIPLLHDLGAMDLPGAFFRKIAVCLYVTLAAGTTFAVCFVIFDQSVKGRGFGTMACTHLEVGNKHVWRDKYTIDDDCVSNRKWII